MGAKQTMARKTATGGKMILDDKLIELFRFYAKQHEDDSSKPARRLSDDMYSVLPLFLGEDLSGRRPTPISMLDTTRHVAWMATEAIGFLKEARAADTAIARMRPTGVPQTRVSAREKAHRWLGFIQGVLWMSGCFTLDELKEHSRRCSDEPEKKEDLRLQSGEVGCDCGGEATGPFSVKHRRGCIIPGPHNDPIEKGKK
jgi:hypothetical protein